LGEDPYEVFTGSNHDHDGEIVISKSIESGKIIKKTRGRYVLIADGKDEEFDLTNGHADANADALTRMVSTSLRHGADIRFVVEQLEKTHGDLFAFAKVLARTLKKYIPDQVLVGETIDGCETPDKCQVEMVGGCKMCKSCGKGEWG
jgi:hypothetical protein